MVYVSFAAMRRAFHIGQILAEQLPWSGPEEKMSGEVPVEQRDNILAGPKRDQHSDRRRLVSNPDGDRPLDTSLLVELKNPLFQTAPRYMKR